MSFEEFRASLTHDSPPKNLSPLLESLWFDGKGDWEAAHNIAQDIHSNDGSWVHAYLHRKEGDAGNASYWYRRAGKPVFSGSLEDEWVDLVKNLL